MDETERLLQQARYGCVAEMHFRWTLEEIRSLPECPMWPDEIGMM